MTGVTQARTSRLAAGVRVPVKVMLHVMATVPSLTICTRVLGEASRSVTPPPIPKLCALVMSCPVEDHASVVVMVSVPAPPGARRRRKT